MRRSLASLGGARQDFISPRARPAVTSFYAALRRNEDDRHAAILGGTLDVPPYPVGFRAEDVLGRSEAEGFLPLADAARVMGISEEEVAELVRLGLLEAEPPNLVRPALVAVLSVEG